MSKLRLPFAPLTLLAMRAVPAMGRERHHAMGVTEVPGHPRRIVVLTSRVSDAAWIAADGIAAANNRAGRYRGRLWPCIDPLSVFRAASCRSSREKWSVTHD